MRARGQSDAKGYRQNGGIAKFQGVRTLIFFPYTGDMAYANFELLL